MKRVSNNNLPPSTFHTGGLAAGDLWEGRGNIASGKECMYNCTYIFCTYVRTFSGVEDKGFKKDRRKCRKNGKKAKHWEKKEEIENEEAERKKEKDSDRKKEDESG